MKNLTVIFFTFFFTCACSSPSGEAESSSGSSSDSNSVTTEDVAQGEEQFLIHANSAAILVESVGATTHIEEGNKIAVEGKLTVNGQEFPVAIIYWTDEEETPDNQPTIATLSLTLHQAEDASNMELIKALTGEKDFTTNPAIMDDPISLTFHFTQRIVQIDVMLSEDGVITGEEGESYEDRFPSSYSNHFPFEIVQR